MSQQPIPAEVARVRDELDAEQVRFRDELPDCVDTWGSGNLGLDHNWGLTSVEVPRLHFWPAEAHTRRLNHAAKLRWCEFDVLEVNERTLLLHIYFQGLDLAWNRAMFIHASNFLQVGGCLMFNAGWKRIPLTSLVLDGRTNHLMSLRMGLLNEWVTKHIVKALTRMSELAEGSDQHYRADNALVQAIDIGVKPPGCVVSQRVEWNIQEDW